VARRTPVWRSSRGPPRLRDGGRGAYEHLFTVFTPTLNRAHTLDRVYSSLATQTFRDFEWLIVDDGSTHGTQALVDHWQRHASFPIRYLRQETRGKHVAFNAGVREATGELFVPLDSDDACVPNALERFREHWTSIPAEQLPRFSGVTALCVDQHGNLVGSRFPSDVVDSNSLEIHYRYHVRGEKWGFIRTDVLRDFPFPDPGSVYVPESVVWAKIARRYLARFVNEVLRIYYIGAPSIMSHQAASKFAVGGRLQHLGVLNEQLDYARHAPVQFFLSAAHYARFSFHLGASIAAQFREIESAGGRLLWSLAVPAGWVLPTRCPASRTSNTGVARVASSARDAPG